MDMSSLSLPLISYKTFIQTYFQVLLMCSEVTIFCLDFHHTRIIGLTNPINME